MQENGRSASHTRQSNPLEPSPLSINLGVYPIRHVVVVASTPLALTTPSPEFCAGIGTGRPLDFAVNATISLSINSRVSLARSSTSEGFKFLVSMGFKTAIG